MNEYLCTQWETFWDDRGQQTYRVNPLFSELCACSELRKQWKFTRYVCCRLALESLLFLQIERYLSNSKSTHNIMCFFLVALFNRKIQDQVSLLALVYNHCPRACCHIFWALLTNTKLNCEPVQATLTLIGWFLIIKKLLLLKW